MKSNTNAGLIATSFFLYLLVIPTAVISYKLMINWSPSHQILLPALLVVSTAIIIRTVLRKVSIRLINTTLIVTYSIFVGLFISEGLLVATSIQKAKQSSKAKLSELQRLRGTINKEYEAVIYPSAIMGVEFNQNAAKRLHLGGIPNRPTLLCKELEYWAVYQSDRFGFRNNDKLWDSEIDIMVIGDSFSAGNCVNSKKTWPYVVAGTYPKTLNLAMGGNGPLLKLASLKEFSGNVNPKVILWQFYEGNENRAAAEFKNPILQKYLTVDKFKQNLSKVPSNLELVPEDIKKKASTKFEGPPELINTIISAVKLTKIRGVLQQCCNIGAPLPELSLFRKAIQSAAIHAQKIDAKLIFIYIPSSSVFSRKNQPMWIASKEQILDVVSNLGIPIIDTQVPMSKHAMPNDLYAEGQNQHLNEVGYQLVGEYIVKCLKELLGY